MRFKNLLGLLAIGGAVAYAQKKRGGELSVDGFKKSLRSLVDNAKNKIGDVKSQVAGDQQGDRDRDMGTVGTSNLGSVGGQDDIGGYAQGTQGSSGYDSGIGTDYGSGIGNGLGTGRNR